MIYEITVQEIFLGLTKLIATPEIYRDIDPSPKFQPQLDPLSRLSRTKRAGPLGLAWDQNLAAWLRLARLG
jgi:hypothetical protein